MKFTDEEKLLVLEALLLATDWQLDFVETQQGLIDEEYEMEKAEKFVHLYEKLRRLY